MLHLFHPPGADIEDSRTQQPDFVAEVLPGQIALARLPDDNWRYFPPTIAEAALALREAADQLAEAPDGYVGWLVRRASQFPRPPQAPRQMDVNYWILVQEYRLQRSPW
ncbi:MAG TPA: hypothetical protein VGI78_16975 [Acetobacteraceae bacterium]|jgi:hypothetical protein